jgi:hypothetical protein
MQISINMKTSKFLFLIFLFIMSTALSKLQACDFSFKINSEEKLVYRIGDEVVVLVSVYLTHRNCPESINNIKFDFSGLKALGATPWKESGEGKFERKFKLQVSDDPKGKHILNATRTCDKDGGTGSIKFNVK